MYFEIHAVKFPKAYIKFTDNYDDLKSSYMQLHMYVCLYVGP